MSVTSDNDSEVECSRCNISLSKKYMKKMNGEWLCEFDHIIAWFENN